jgi:hypothetical protein
MTTSLQDDLAELTGEELYNLINELGRATTRAVEVATTPAERDRVQGNLAAMWCDLLEVELIARAQIARITVPIREAVQIIYRAKYARNHPVRVPGT